MLSASEKTPDLIATDRRAQGLPANAHRRQSDLLVGLPGLCSHALPRMAGQQQVGRVERSGPAKSGDAEADCRVVHDMPRWVGLYHVRPGK